jgi:hypothetical protein
MEPNSGKRLYGGVRHYTTARWSKAPTWTYTHLYVTWETSFILALPHHLAHINGRLWDLRNGPTPSTGRNHAFLMKINLFKSLGSQCRNCDKRVKSAFTFAFSPSHTRYPSGRFIPNDMLTGEVAGGIISMAPPRASTKKLIFWATFRRCLRLHSVSTRLRLSRHTMEWNLDVPEGAGSQYNAIHGSTYINPQQHLVLENNIYNIHPQPYRHFSIVLAAFQNCHLNSHPISYQLSDHLIWTQRGYQMADHCVWFPQTSTRQRQIVSIATFNQRLRIGCDSFFTPHTRW